MINLKKLFDIEKTLANLDSDINSIEGMSGKEKRTAAKKAAEDLIEEIKYLDETEKQIKKITPKMAEKIRQIKEKATKGLNKITKIASS